jgi:hypothetical protein
MSATHTNVLQPFYQVKTLDPEDFNFTSSGAEITVSSLNGGLISIGPITNSLSAFNGAFFSGSGDFVFGSSIDNEYVLFTGGTASIQTKNFIIDNQSVVISNGNMFSMSSSIAHISNSNVISSSIVYSTHSNGYATSFNLHDGFIGSFNVDQNKIESLGITIHSTDHYIGIGNSGIVPSLNSYNGMYLSSSGEFSLGSSSAENITFNQADKAIKLQTDICQIDSTQNRVNIQSTATSSTPLIISASIGQTAPLQV